MANIDKRWYQDRAVLNVLANSIDNAREVFDVAEGHVLVGILSKNYATAEEAVAAMKAYGSQIDEAVSIGLGGGDPRQAEMVVEIAKHYEGAHINQVFPAVGITRGHLGDRPGWINALVMPTGKVGYVNIATGPSSVRREGHAGGSTNAAAVHERWDGTVNGREHEKRDGTTSGREHERNNAGNQAIVPVEAAIALVRDMGGNALKYYPMGGLSHEEEYRAIAKACGKMQFALEPTGGIDLDNFEAIVRIALEENVPKLIPHVYTSIIDPITGSTRTEDVRALMMTMKRLVEQYGA